MNSAESVIAAAFERHKKSLEAAGASLLPAITEGAEMLLHAVREGRMVFACGKGGSAADSQHFAAEFVCKYSADRPPLRALALTTDTSALTAIGNDYGFEQVFSRQIEALGNAGDVLVAFSTSGGSKNILAALDAAQRKEMRTILLTGSKGAGSPARPAGGRAADLVIAVPTDETARIQEVHELIYHAWCEYIDAAAREKDSHA